MDLEEIPLKIKLNDIPDTIENIFNKNIFSDPNAIVVLIKPYSNFFVKLVEKGFLVLEEEKTYSDIFFVKNLFGKDIDFLLKETIGLSYKELQNKKKLKLKDFKNNEFTFTELIDSLIDCDRYFDYVDINEEELKNTLFLKGLIEFCGKTGHYCVASEKLTEIMFNTKDYEEIFFMLTNKKFKDLDKFYRRTNRIKEQKELFLLAKKYNYSLKKEVIKWDDYLL